MPGAGSDIASAFGLNVRPRGSKPLISEIGAPEPAPAPPAQSSSLFLDGGGDPEEDDRQPAAGGKPMISVLSSVEEPVEKPSLIQPTAAPAKRKPLITEHVEEALPDFQPSQSFAGARTGFVYKSGPQGAGYYRDLPGAGQSGPSATGGSRVRSSRTDQPDPGVAGSVSGTVSDLSSQRGGNSNSNSHSNSGRAAVTLADSDATRCSVCACSCTAKKLLRCSGCKISWYCSAQCQRAAWPRHRASCLKAQGKVDNAPRIKSSNPIAAVKKAAAAKGKSKIDDLKICYKCGGLGQYTETTDIMSGMHGDKFSGLQRVITSECPACEGEGYVDVTKHPNYKHEEGSAPEKRLSPEEQAKVYADYKASMTPEQRAEFESKIKKAREGIAD